MNRILFLVCFQALWACSGASPQPTPAPPSAPPEDSVQLNGPGDQGSNCGRDSYIEVDGRTYNVPALCQDPGRNLGDPPDNIFRVPAVELER